MSKSDDIVVFMHDGRVISNDPRWGELSNKEKAKLAKANFGEAPAEDDSEEDAGTSEDGQSEGVEDPYAGMNAEQLKDELAARLEAGREIDTKGIKKKAELIEALKADDEAQAAEADEQS